MHELITKQDEHNLAHRVADEALPPLAELVREYNAMVAERRQQQREQEIRFGHTMATWAERERGDHS